MPCVGEKKSQTKEKLLASSKEYALIVPQLKYPVYLMNRVKFRIPTTLQATFFFFFFFFFIPSPATDQRLARISGSVVTALPNNLFVFDIASSGSRECHNFVPL